MYHDTQSADELASAPLRLLKCREVCERLSCASTTVHRWVNEGILPPPVRLGGSSRWKSTDIDECIANLERRKIGDACLSDARR